MVRGSGPAAPQQSAAVLSGRESGALAALHERLEITDLDSGARRVVDVAATTAHLTITSAGELAFVDDPAGAVLRLVPTRAGHRLEPTAAFGRVVVNGEDLFCKDLLADDTFELGRFHLRWLAAAPERAARPAAVARPGAVAARADGAARLRPPRRSQASKLPVLAVFSMLLIGIAVALRVCARSDWPHTPQHFLDLARTQYGNGRLAEALATIDLVLQERDPATTAAAAVLRREVERAMVAVDLAVVVQKAREEFEVMLGPSRRPTDPAQVRPFAREVVHQCDGWLQQYEARLGDDAGRRLRAAVRERRRAHLDAAVLDQPEAAADVLFAAREQLRFQPRGYRAAFARLDDYLARHGDDAAVRRERGDMATAGRIWYAEQVQRIDRVLQEGRRDEAAMRWRSLERHASLAEWDDLAAALRAKLAAPAQGSAR